MIAQGGVSITDGALDAAAQRYQLAVGHDGAAVGRARDEFVTALVPFADRLASRYRGRGVPYDDLCQVARLALIKAVDQLDTDRGSFTAYAVVTVRGALRRHFRDTSWDAHVPRPVQELTLRLWGVADDLTRELKRPPSRAELAGRLGVATEELTAALLASDAKAARSLNAPVTGDDGAAELGDLLGGPDQELDGIDDRVTMRDLLARLPARERRILALRFYGNQTQMEIAEATGLSQMHVSRLLARTLAWLREAMLSDTPPPFPGVDEPVDGDLAIEVTHSGGLTVVAVRGEVDADNADRLRAAVTHCCRHAGTGVRVDLRRVPLVDAAGAAALARAYAVAHARGVDLALLEPNPTVTRILRVTGLGHLVARTRRVSPSAAG
ncbi:sigma-70 family RNA polymerase sigma factor [Asanoa sp. WMMD1127]|uniref:sigma-70 family RNA polymerase sigma factor n=1 Tax=Asanoa sp. WMMD1127 TaxID=3016107 RepID=UPI0024176266|nr:sigma-70 family RNA polymerase sigma factor [Asanoa sp. WMMD1127]MDG4824835.1 sigma-70 family RNA polymerase sigma factor [Asanoa sp. WMMD1127]